MKKSPFYAYSFPNQKKWVDRLLHSIRFLFFIFLLIPAISIAQAPIVAPVNPPTGGFNIDGTLKATATVGDWTSGAGGGYVLQNTAGTWGPVDGSKTSFTPDGYGTLPDLIINAGKFGTNPNTWTWKSANTLSKCDIGTGLIHSTTSTTSKWLILGGDRLGQSGTSYIDFQFSQGLFTRVGTGSSGSFSSVGPNGQPLDLTNGRTPGDFVLSMEYTNGGALATVHYYKWEMAGNTYKYVEYPIPGTAIDPSAFGRSNTVATEVPYGAFGSTTYQPYAFAEAAVNIDAIIGINNCQAITIRSVCVTTKSSDAYTADLKDFVEPQLVDFQFGSAGLAYDGGPDFCQSEGTLTPSTPAVPQGDFTVIPDVGLSINSSGVIDLAASAVGSYTVTYTPTGGVCLTPANATVNVHANPTISSPAIGDICAGTTSATLTHGGVTSSANKYKITWTSGLTSMPDYVDLPTPASPITISGTGSLTAATYSGTIYVKNSTTGCESAGSPVSLIVHPNPTISSPAIGAICAGTTSTTLTHGGVTNSANKYKITWTSGLTSMPDYVDLPTPASPITISGTGSLAAATYSGTIYVKNSTTGCESAGSPVSLIVHPNPTISSPAIGAICAGTTSTTLTHGGVTNSANKYKITWTSGLTSMPDYVDLPTPASPITISGTGSLAAATYSGTIYVKNSTTGCESAGSPVSLIVHPNPTISSPAIGAICAGTTSTTLTHGGVTNSANKYKITWTSGLTSMPDYVDLPTPASPITISGTGSLVAGTYNGTIYVKNNTTGCISAGNAVSLVVNANPGTPTLSVTQPTCGNSNGNVTVTDPTGADYEYSNNDGAFQASTSFTVAAGAGYSIKVKRLSTGCISLAATGTMGSATGTPAADVLILTSPSCTSSTGTLKVVQASNGALYDNAIFEIAVTGINTWYATDHVFSYTAGAGYSFTVRKKLDITCTAVASCNGEVAGKANQPTSEDNSKTIQSVSGTDEGATVKAFPNPFNDRVKFVVTVPHSGYGTLELMNMQGQKVKTIYNGKFVKGGQLFEMEVPPLQNATLIYVFRMGGKQITGKLVQLNQ